jgi:hypothetical protein
MQKILVKKNNKIKFIEVKTFEDLVFVEHPISKDARIVLSEVEDLNIDSIEYFKEMLDSKCSLINISDKVKLSILIGSIFYSNGIDTYELYDFNDEPCGYLSKKEVTKIMIKYQIKYK